MDDTGTPVNHIVYDGYGSVAPQSDESEAGRYSYTGREFDEETGLYYYRARFYDATLGRFISEDPIGFSSGEANLYRYVGNSPANFIDPFGLKHKKKSKNKRSASGNRSDKRIADAIDKSKPIGELNNRIIGIENKIGKLGQKLRKVERRRKALELATETARARLRQHKEDSAPFRIPGVTKKSLAIGGASDLGTLGAAEAGKDIALHFKQKALKRIIVVKLKDLVKVGTGRAIATKFLGTTAPGFAILAHDITLACIQNKTLVTGIDDAARAAEILERVEKLLQDKIKNLGKDEKKIRDRRADLKARMFSKATESRGKESYRKSRIAKENAKIEASEKARKSLAERQRRFREKAAAINKGSGTNYTVEGILKNRR